MKISTIGVQIKIKRRMMKLSQNKLATLSGLSAVQICNIEKGKYVPSLGTLISLGKVLNFEVKLVDKEKK